MKKTRITIHDIAKSLDISASTVSRALNKNIDLVSSKTKNLVFNKAKELGYHKNSLASNLRKGNSNTIGVIVPRISRAFCSSVIGGIEEVAFNAQYNVVIGQSLESLKREEKLIDTFMSNRVDGILLIVSMETVNNHSFKEIIGPGTPLIFVDRPFNTSKNINVIIDDFQAAYMATEHLIKSGSTNIFYFSGPNSMEIYKNRLNGYKRALKNHGIPVKEQYIFESKLMKEDGIKGAKEILNLGSINGVFCANDTVAVNAMHYLKTKGIKIPEDIAIVGFNNNPISLLIEPSLTTIAQPDFEMGKVAASLLIGQLKGGNKQKDIRTIILKSKLIKRNSTK